MSAVAARAVGLLAAWCGTGIGVVAAVAGRVGRTGPGVLGPLLICYGLHLAWAPAAWVAAGGFLLLIDRRVP